MGYNPQLVTDYKVTYGKSLSGYTHEDSYDKLDGFESFLDKLGVEHYRNSADEMSDLEHSIKSDDLLDCEDRLDSLDLTEDEKEIALYLIKTAKTAEYAKDGGYLKVHWF